MQLMVFISSRLVEEEERKAVEEAVYELWTHEKLPFTFWSWESAKEIPSGKPPDEVQSEGVRNSDIYVLILCSEYGNFEYGESPTHKEYDIACSELEDDRILIYFKGVGRREEKLEKWIGELKYKNKHTLRSFKNPDKLKDLVKTRLRDLWYKGKWKVNIPTIQSTLRKEETTKGDFFKKAPEWVDFEEGFVVERKEVNEIIKKLENDNIQLVLGEPASGKSIILKNIGFKLAKENKDVYIVELKKHSSDEVKRYFEDIPEIKDEKAVFIVDDAHLLSTECERLVREFKNRKLKSKLIIGSRSTRKIRGEHPTEASEFEYLSKTDIHAEDVTEEMIKRFLKIKHQFSDERIKTVSKNLEKYRKDLWHLSWALKTYNPKKDTVEEKEIYEKIRDSIRDINAGKDKPRINAEDVFLPLSIFYQFEIPVVGDFLEELLEIEKDKINKLIGLSEIIETEEIGKNRTLSLIHSSIADLYFKAYWAYPSLGKRSKEKILEQKDEDLLQYCLFYKYMTSTDPRNAIDVVIQLGGDCFMEKGGRTLLEQLIEDDKIQKSIKKGIVKEENIGKIGWSMRYIAEANKKVAREIVSYADIDTLSSRIVGEKDASENTVPLVVGIAAASKELGLKLVDSVLKGIEKEEDIRQIGWLLGGIAGANKEVAREIINRINVDGLLTKVEKEEDVGRIGLCVGGIAKANKEVAQEIANRINVDVLLSKIEKEADIGKIRWCVGAIAEVSEEVEREIVNRLNPKLREELQKEGG